MTEFSDCQTRSRLLTGTQSNNLNRDTFGQQYRVHKTSGHVKLPSQQSTRESVLILIQHWFLAEKISTRNSKSEKKTHMIRQLQHENTVIQLAFFLFLVAI